MLGTTLQVTRHFLQTNPPGSLSIYNLQIAQNIQTHKQFLEKIINLSILVLVDQKVATVPPFFWNLLSV